MAAILEMRGIGKSFPGVRALDRYTVQFKLEQPRPRFLYSLSAGDIYGAVAREVLLQFLVEAVVLSMLGGLIGLLVAQAAIGALSWAGGLPFLFVPEINVIAFAISAAIGVVFGYFPARRAAGLNPIDALRHE